MSISLAGCSGNTYLQLTKILHMVKHLNEKGDVEGSACWCLFSYFAAFFVFLTKPMMIFFLEEIKREKKDLSLFPNSPSRTFPFLAKKIKNTKKKGKKRCFLSAFQHHYWILSHLAFLLHCLSISFIVKLILIRLLLQGRRHLTANFCPQYNDWFSPWPWSCKDHTTFINLLRRVWSCSCFTKERQSKQSKGKSLAEEISSSITCFHVGTWETFSRFPTTVFKGLDKFFSWPTCHVVHLSGIPLIH